MMGCRLVGFKDSEPTGLTLKVEIQCKSILSSVDRGQQVLSAGKRTMQFDPTLNK